MLKRLKLSQKISFLIGLLILIGISMISIFVLRGIYVSSSEQAVAFAEEVSGGNSKDIKGDLELVNATVQGLRNSIGQMRSDSYTDRTKIIDLLNETLKNSPNQVLAVYTAWEPNLFDGKDNEFKDKDGHDNTGRFVPYVSRSGSSIELTPLTDYDKEGAGDYYLIPKKTKKPALIEPYIYKVNGKDVLMTSLVIPILDDKGEFIGMAGADIALSSLQEKISSIKPMGGYTGIISNKGTIVANSQDSTMISKNIINIDKSQEEILRKIQAGNNFISYDKSMITGTTSLKLYEPINISNIECNWSFVSIIPNEKIYESYYNTLKNVLIISAVVFLIIILALYWLIKKSIDPIIAASKHLNYLANADFTPKLPEKYEQLQDEAGDLIKDIKTMQSSIKEIIRNVIIEAGKVENSAITADNHITDLNGDINEIFVNTENLSAGMEETSASVQEITSASSQIQSIIESVSLKTNEGEKAISEISKRASDLKATAINSQNNAAKIYKDTQSKLKLAIENSKAVEEITVLSDSILQITSQTNLLALNADIEAARAGEAGKGFSVVANQIKKLAQDSHNTVNEIQRITKIVLAAVENLSENSEEVLEFIDKQVVNDYIKMVEVGEQYNKDADYMHSLITEFSLKAETLYLSITDMVKAINEIANATSEGAFNTTVIAEKAGKVVEKSNEVMNQTKAMKDSSMILGCLVSKFKVDRKH